MGIIITQEVCKAKYSLRTWVQDIESPPSLLMDGSSYSRLLQSPGTFDGAGALRRIDLFNFNVCMRLGLLT
jgi:hypothetical protein